MADEKEDKEPETPVILPSNATELDPNAESLVIIGTQGMKVRREAHEHIYNLESHWDPSLVFGVCRLLRPTQVNKIGGLEVFTNLRELVLRSNLIMKMEGLSTLTGLVHLELYDNGVEALEVRFTLPLINKTPK